MTLPVSSSLPFCPSAATQLVTGKAADDGQSSPPPPPPRNKPYNDTDHSARAAIAKYKPQDATTNPSLILAASKKPEYAKLTDTAIAWAKQQGGDIDAQVDQALDRLLVEFGKEILAIVPGKVSTEVDARFSFDTQASVKKALRIIDVRPPFFSLFLASRGLKRTPAP